MTANSTRERKLFEETLHPSQVLTLVRVNLGIGSLEIRIGKNSRRTVAWSGDENRIQVIFINQPIEVDIGEGLSGIRAPVA